MPEITPFLFQVGSIVLIDLVLSGDNAVVIAMATHRLPARQRKLAALFGAAGAAGLRILFTSFAALLLGVPYLQAIGGAVLVWIAFKLLVQEEEGHELKPAETLRQAIMAIVAADVIMSLDNVLAVGGAAHGNLWLLLFGLALSIPIVIWGSTFVAGLMNRFSWLPYLGAGVLAWTAGAMMMHDKVVGHQVNAVLPGMTWVLPGLVTLAVIGFGYLKARRAPKHGLDVDGPA